MNAEIEKSGDHHRILHRNKTVRKNPVITIEYWAE
jgi:hypothetical protein